MCVSSASLSNAHHYLERRDLERAMFFQSPDFVHCTHRYTHCLHHQSWHWQLALANWLLVLANWLLVLANKEVLGTVGWEFDEVPGWFWGSSSCSSESMGLYFLAFGVLGCFSAVFVFPFGSCVPCLRESSWSCGDLEWSLTRFCRPTVAEFSSSLWISWFSCIPRGGGTTGCCRWQACEDERGCSRSRDLDLSNLLERLLCSADGCSPADGDEGLRLTLMLTGLWTMVTPVQEQNGKWLIYPVRYKKRDTSWCPLMELDVAVVWVLLPVCSGCVTREATFRNCVTGEKIWRTILPWLQNARHSGWEFSAWQNCFRQKWTTLISWSITLTVQLSTKSMRQHCVSAGVQVHRLWTKTNCSLLQHLHSLWLAYMPWLRMTTFDGHLLRCAMFQGRREVPPHGRPVRFVLNRCLLIHGRPVRIVLNHGLLMELPSVCHSLRLVGRPLSLITLNLSANYDSRLYGRPARRMQQHGHVRKPPLQQ